MLERPSFKLLIAIVIVKFEEKLSEYEWDEIAGRNPIFSPSGA